jgi:hypothetical protein
MLWTEFNIKQDNENGNIRIEGETPTEVMEKERPLYKPGDVFIVNEDGWLVKQYALSPESTKRRHTAYPKSPEEQKIQMLRNK